VELRRDKDVEGTNIVLCLSHATVILQLNNMSTTIPKAQQFPTNFLALMAGEKVDPVRGERIERLIDRQGWGPSHLARVMRCDRSLIYNWKAGKEISSDLLERLAVALETTRLYIETGEGDAQYHREEPPAVILKQLADAAEEERAAEDAQTAPSRDSPPAGDPPTD
jgi:hypothetical protein